MRLRSAINSLRQNGRHRLDTPVDSTFLVIFRIAFGLLMLLDIFWYFHHGFISSHFIQPEYTFTYFGFGWVKPLPGMGMYLLFGLVGFAGLLIALGWHYRAAAITFTIGFAYIFLVDQTLYLNHNYMIVLIGMIMTVLPAHRAFSMDAWRGRVTSSATAPCWTLWLLRGQIGLVYFFGGVAKLNADWLQGEPLRMWLGGRRDMAVIGPWLDTEFTVYFFSYGGLFFDLLIVPLLLFRRTRILALFACAFFHLTNSMVFQIGIFPWLMLASTFLFFPPDTVARWLPLKCNTSTSLTPTRPWLFATLAVFIAIQLVLPLRHWWYPGDVAWTEEGHRFSWRMKLRSKQGWLHYRVVDPQTSHTAIVQAGQFLTPFQAIRIATRPDMILQGAHILAKQGEEELGHRPQVFAESFCTLNGRAPKRLIDSSVDLAGEPRSLRSSAWIVPFEPTTVRNRTRSSEVPIISPWRTIFFITPDSPKLRSSVIQRILQHQIDRIDTINQTLSIEFEISIDGYYTLAGNAIYALTLKPELAGKQIRIESDELEQLKQYFDVRLHRVIRNQPERMRYNELATQKQLISQRLELLAGMAPAESIQGLEIE